MALRYTTEELIKLRPSAKELAAPLDGLLYIVVSSAGTSGKAPVIRAAGHGGHGGHGGNKWNPRAGSSSSHGSKSQQPQAPKLKESETSFSASRRRADPNQTAKVISDLRAILNKVTEENIAVLITETKEKCCPAVLSLMKDFGTTEEREALLTQLAKLFAQKAQIDHAFSKWYAELAAQFTVPEFGDVLYEVCRENLPAIRYDPDKKRGYLGALLLLVELRRVKLVSILNLEAAADRIFTAIDRNLGNTVMATTTEAPIDSGVQIEVCVELLCKYLPAFFALERPEPEIVETYVSQLRTLSENTARIKPRSKFLLSDFLKLVAK